MSLRKQLKKSFILPLLTVLAVPSVYGQETDTPNENTFSISTQIRPRLEIKDGAYQPLYKGEDPAALISDRIRLNLDYSYKGILSLRIAPQQVGIWGQANMVQGAENSGNRIALFETWAKLKLASNWDMKLGRQVISLDDERIFGELDWAQGGRVHDAVSFHFSKNKYELKGFFAFNQNYKSNYGNNLSNPSGNLYNTTDAFPYKWMQTAWASFPVGKTSKINLLFANIGAQNVAPLINLNDQPNKTRFSQTYGVNYFNNGDKWSGNVSAYYQGGKSITNIKNQAYLVAAAVNYKINESWSVGLGSDLVSGNDLGASNDKNNAFNPLFHTGHKFYGSMDYFYSGNGHSNVGLSDSYLKINYKGKQNYNINLAVHQFATSNQVTDFTGNYKKNLGQEADLSFSYKLNKFSTVMGGYSFYINTPTLSYLKNVPNSQKYQQWGWVSINITPTLFHTKF
ncbi:MAG: alginate export family protein [Chitinophagales bacterium]|nr:alginate export family protein [Chitinophagales bacterium]